MGDGNLILVAGALSRPVSSCRSWRRASGCPALLLFLGIGMAIGDGTGWIDSPSRDFELARTVGVTRSRSSSSRAG